MAPIYLQADITLDVSEYLACNDSFALATTASHYFQLVWPRAKNLLEEVVKLRARLLRESQELEKQRNVLEEQKRESENNIRALEEQRDTLLSQIERDRQELDESRKRRERLEELQGGVNSLKEEWDTISSQDPCEDVYKRRELLNASIERIKRQVLALEEEVDRAAAMRREPQPEEE